MKRVTINSRAAADIDHIVTRIHRDIGNPIAKVDLAAVRHVLNLDLGYYRSSDAGLLTEVMHKLHLGAKQVILRPTLLLDAIRQFDLRALILPDRRKILIDQDQPQLKLRWHEAHEISHGVIPWHPAYTLGDNRNTLSPQCQDIIEAEANWGAGRLLFPGTVFREMAHAEMPSFKFIGRLSEHFGNTITSTLWRLVEQSERPMLGIIGAHPHHAVDNATVIAHFVQSERFAEEFPNISEDQVIAALRSYCGYKKSGPLGCGLVVMIDANGSNRSFHMESFGNSHQCLTLGYE